MARKKQQERQWYEFASVEEAREHFIEEATVYQWAVLITAYTKHVRGARPPWTRMVKGIRHDVYASDWIPLLDPPPRMKPEKAWPYIVSGVAELTALLAWAEEFVRSIIERARTTKFRFNFDSNDPGLVRGQKALNGALLTWLQHLSRIAVARFNRHNVRQITLATLPIRLACEKQFQTLWKPTQDADATRQQPQTESEYVSDYLESLQ